MKDKCKYMVVHLKAPHITYSQAAYFSNLNALKCTD